MAGDGGLYEILTKPMKSSKMPTEAISVDDYKPLDPALQALINSNNEGHIYNDPGRREKRR